MYGEHAANAAAGRPWHADHDRLADHVAGQVWDLQPRQRFAYGDFLAALQSDACTFPTLFDVTYSYTRIPETGNAEWIWKDSSLLASGYSLDVVNIVVRDYERDGALEVDLFYADDVFDANYDFDDALSHVVTLISGALAAPGTPVGESTCFPAQNASSSTHSPPERRSMLDLPRSTSIDLLAAGVPGGRSAVVSAGGPSPTPSSTPL